MRHEETTKADRITMLADVTHVVLRAGAGLLFLQHGLSKVFGLLGGTAVPLASMFGVAGLMELVGGVLLIVGSLTRPVAAVLMVQMVVAYVIGHQIDCLRADSTAAPRRSSDRASSGRSARSARGGPACAG